MMSTRRSPLLNFTAPLVLEPPRHCGLSSIALAPGRHLIGTSDECAIRVNVEGVVGRHALILVGENRTIVKSIDSRTWVNDGPVTEMALRAGDRLSIGPLTFRIRTATSEEAAAFHSVERHDPTEREEVPVAVGPTLPAPVEIERPAITAVSMGLPLPPALSPTIPVNEEKTADPIVAEPDIPAVPVQNLLEGAATDFRSDQDSIDSRLNELEQRLVELQQSRTVSQLPTPLREVEAGQSAEVTRQVDFEELRRRSEQLAIEARELQERTDRVADREVQVEQRRVELAQEAERISKSANAAREALSVEHALHLKTWQEWESTYARMTNDLTTRLESLEHQHGALQIESDRINAAKLEFQRARAEYDQSKRLLADEQLKLVNERAELSLLRSKLDAQQKQLRRDADEHNDRKQADLLEIGRQQADFLTAQQNLECERTAILAERTTNLHRLDQENQRRASLQEMFERDRQTAAMERDELLRLKSELERTRSELESERTRMPVVSQPSVEADVEIEILRRRCHATELEVAQLRAEKAELSRINSELQSSVAISPPALTTTVVPLHQLVDVQPFPTNELVDSMVEWPMAPPTPVSSEELEVSASSALSEHDFRGEPVQFDWDSHDVYEAEVPTAVPSEPVSHSDDVPENTEGYMDAVDWDALNAVHQKLDDSSSGSGEGNRGFDAGYSYGTSGGLDPSYFPQPNQLSNWAIPDSRVGTSSPAAFGTDPWASVSASFESTPSTPSAFHETATGAVDPWANSANSTPMSFAHENERATTESHGYEGFLPTPSATMESSEEAAGFALLEQLMATKPAPFAHVDETIAAVNRDFGVPVDTAEEVPQESALPAWWDQNSNTADAPSSAEVGHPNWVVDALRDSATPSPSLSPTPSQDVPATDLRSQLAMLFDLPTSALDEKAKESSGSDVPENTPVESALPPIPTEVPAPPEPVSKSEVPNAAHDSREPSTSEDSVEEFMARLLARSRGSAVDEETSVSKAPAAVPLTPATKAEPVAVVEPESTDRSHLMAEPKHKQNKQAVRENLQSFRQVAHLSARSALAKHSHQQLLNATIAKGTLFGISTVATGVYLIDPLLGNTFQLWKAGACFLATVLSAMETRRSWKQLTDPLGSHVHPESHHADDDSERKPEESKVDSNAAEVVAGPNTSNEGK
ncbi:MAG: hypothetical protein U0941_25520 [Planctomycetaceae bacterium]